MLPHFAVFQKETIMPLSINFRLVAVGAASALTLGGPGGEHEEPDKTRYDMPA